MMTFDLHTFLDEAARRPWRYGYEDCTLFVGNFVHAYCGRDPGAGIRGTYDDEAGAARVIDAAGGMLPFIAERLAAVGWRRAADGHRDCDVGVVEAPLAPLGRTGHIPAIMAGGMWHIRTLRGVRASLMFPTLATWRRWL